MSSSRPSAPDGYAWPVLLAAFVAASAVVTLVSLFAPWWAPTPEVFHYVEVTSEVNLPMWWTVLLLIGAGVLMLLVAASAPNRRAGLAWRLAAVAALLMSLDDATLLHEKLGLFVEQTWPDARLSVPWLVLGIPLALTVVLLAWFAARRLPATPGRLLLGGFVLFLGSAVGLELVAELVLRADGHWFLHRFVYHLEEGFEMTGAALLLTAPLSDLRRARIRSGAPGPETREAQPPLP